MDESSSGGATEQTDPLLSALAEDPYLSATQVQRGEVGCGKLANSQPGGIGRLHESPITGGQSGPNGILAEFADGRSQEVRLDDSEQAADLLDLEHPWQPPRQAGCGD